MSRYNRLTDNDWSFGPIDIGERSPSYRPFRISLCSGCDEYPGGSFNISAFGWSIRLRLYDWLAPKPDRKWVNTTNSPWNKDRTPSGYFDVNEVRYGFSISDNFVQIFLGRQTHDSTTDRTKCFSFPWTEWRYFKQRFYDIHGNLVREDSHIGWEEIIKLAEQPENSLSFNIIDYDGEVIRTTVYIVENEYKFGGGKFKWLSLFRKNSIVRNLEIKYASEVGRKKGTWKGGMVGHSFEMEKDMSLYDAILTYCEKNKIQLADDSTLKLLKFINKW